jgi:hypothetical protein
MIEVSIADPDALNVRAHMPLERALRDPAEADRFFFAEQRRAKLASDVSPIE